MSNWMPKELRDKPHAWQVGFLARAHGEPLKANPFGPTAGYDSVQWRMGWREAKVRRTVRLTDEQMAEIDAESEWS